MLSLSRPICAHAVQASGLKLRVNIAETALIRDGRILGWFFTSRDGVVVRASNHEISPQALYQKLTGGMGSVSTTMNPFNYVALAHFESGVARPLKHTELQQLVRTVQPFRVEGGNRRLFNTCSSHKRTVATVHSCSTWWGHTTPCTAGPTTWTSARSASR